jgi:hypothetical protein
MAFSRHNELKSFKYIYILTRRHAISYTHEILSTPWLICHEIFVYTWKFVYKCVMHFHIHPKIRIQLNYGIQNSVRWTWKGPPIGGPWLFTCIGMGYCWYRYCRQKFSCIQNFMCIPIFSCRQKIMCRQIFMCRWKFMCIQIFMCRPKFSCSRKFMCRRIFMCIRKFICRQKFIPKVYIDENSPVYRNSGVDRLADPLKRYAFHIFQLIYWKSYLRSRLHHNLLFFYLFIHLFIIYFNPFC